MSRPHEATIDVSEYIIVLCKSTLQVQTTSRLLFAYSRLLETRKTNEAKIEVDNYL